LDSNDELPVEPNGHVEQPPEVKRAVAAIARTRVTEALFVFVAVLIALGLVGATAWNTFKVRSLTSQNVKAQDFGLKAIQCILANFAEHRYTNQALHDGIAAKLGIPPTVHTPLPARYSDEQFKKVCDPFGPVSFKEDGNVTTTSR
jgi:hypothetical protein